MSLLDDLEGSIEEEKQLARKKNLALPTMVKNISNEFLKFKKWYKKNWKFTNSSINNFKMALGWKPGFSVTPKSIEYFIDKNKRFRNEDIMAEYVSMLIQNAYNEGHNNFDMPLLKSESGCLHNWAYSFLTGQIDNPLMITIKEKRTGDCCKGLKNAHLKFLYDTTWYCANDCIDSKIVFENNASCHSAERTSNCDVYFYGDIGDWCGRGSHNTRFYSPHMENLVKIKAGTGLKNCKYYLLNEHDNPTKVLK